MTGPESEKWRAANSAEIRKLMVDTKTIRAIPRSEVPAGRKITYYNPQVKSKIKDGVKTYRIRGTIGGDKVEDPGAV